MMFRRQQKITVTVNHHAPYDALIFDLTGVCFHHDTMTVFKRAGIGSVLYYCATHLKNPSRPLYSFFEKICEQEVDLDSCEVIHYKGNRLPRCVVDGLLGHKTQQEILEDIRTSFVKNPDFFASAHERQLVEKFLHLCFGGLADDAFKISPPMVRLVEQLRASGRYKLYVLSNLYNETYDYLLKNNPDFFNLFDGVVISGHVQMIKPYKNIYQHLLLEHDLDPERSLFIDDQEDNVAAARELGIGGIVYNSLDQVINELKQEGILR